LTDFIDEFRIGPQI